jgi:hypothetical protein
MSNRYDIEEAVSGAAGDEGRAYPARPCIVCGESAVPRCGRCRESICAHHEACPNGCDENPPRPLATMRKFQE